jgi:hypothetical protein
MLQQLGDNGQGLPNANRAVEGDHGNVNEYEPGSNGSNQVEGESESRQIGGGMLASIYLQHHSQNNAAIIPSMNGNGEGAPPPPPSQQQQLQHLQQPLLMEASGAMLEDVYVPLSLDEGSKMIPIAYEEEKEPDALRCWGILLELIVTSIVMGLDIHLSVYGSWR